MAFPIVILLASIRLMELRDLPKAAASREVKSCSLPGFLLHLHPDPPLLWNPWPSSGSACQVQGCEGPGEPISLTQDAVGWIDAKSSRLAVLGRRREAGFWDWEAGDQERWEKGQAKRGPAGVDRAPGQGHRHLRDGSAGDTEEPCIKKEE